MKFSPGGVILVLSPHFDDAIWGCYSIIRHNPNVVVATIYAGQPESGELYDWDAICGGLDSHDLVAQRKLEDIRAMRIAGCEYVHFDMLEQQYKPRDLKDVEIILKLLEDYDTEVSQIYAPVAAGGYQGEHPDHYVLRQAALRLIEDYPITFYADMPYSLSRRWPRVPAKNLYLPNMYEFNYQTVTLPKDIMQEKCQIMMGYETQLPILMKLTGRKLNQPDVYKYEVLWEAKKSADVMSPKQFSFSRSFARPAVALQKLVAKRKSPILDSVSAETSE